MATDPKTPPPVRWVHPESDAPAEVREVLRRNTRTRGDDAHVARLEQRLLPLLGGPTAGGGELPVPDTAGTALGAGTSLAPSGIASLAGALGASAPGKVVMAVALAGALGAGSYQVSKTPAPPPAPLERSMALQLSGAATPAVEQIRGSVAPPAPLEPSAPVVDDSARAHARPALPTAAPRRNSPSQLRAEAELLSRARAYSRTDSSQALAAIAEHAQRFPNGALREERELFMIRLFAESGRIDSAREKLRHLEITSPNSPYRDAARAHIDRAVSSERRSPSDIP